MAGFSPACFSRRHVDGIISPNVLLLYILTKSFPFHSLSIYILTKSFPSHFTHTFLILTMDGLTPEQEWSKALSHELLYNEIINHWGVEIFDEYGSYANCAPWQRDRILVWLRKKSYYREYLEEVDVVEAQRADEAEAAAVGGEDEAESTFDEAAAVDNL
jgi:hypothetical protein